MTRARSREVLASKTVDLGELLGSPGAEPVAVRGIRFETGRPGADRIAALAGPAVLVTGVVFGSVRLRQRTGATLYGPGDVLTTGAPEPPPFSCAWRVLEPGLAVLLDEVLLRRIAASQELSSALSRCVSRQADASALLALLFQLPTIEQRLAALLPDLCARFGTVSAAGVLLPAFLTHTVLAALVGVRRPSLTAALGDPHSGVERLPDRRWRVDPELAGLAVAGA